MSAPRPTGLGNRIAPPRFLAWLAMIALAVAAAMLLPGDGARILLIGFDLATLIFLASLAPLLRDHGPEHIAAHAAANDANRTLLLVIMALLAGIIMLVIARELEIGRANPRSPDPATIALVLGTLLITWLAGNVVMAMHYAHLFYSAGAKRGAYAGGLDFPGDDAPDYHDFLNFALVIGMTFQTADIAMTSRAMRRISTWHSLGAFLFNIGVLAFSINLIAGG